MISVGDIVHGHVFLQGRFPQLRLFNEVNVRARFDGFIPQQGQWVAARVLELGPKTIVVSFVELLSDDLVESALAWGA